VNYLNLLHQSGVAERTSSTELGYCSINHVRNLAQLFFFGEHLLPACGKGGFALIVNHDLSNSNKLIQFCEYLLLRSDTLRHACFPTLRSVQIRHDALHIPQEIHLPCTQTIVGCCWRQFVPFSVFYNLIYSLKEQAKKGTSTPKKGTSPRMTSLFKSIPEGDICLPCLLCTLRVVIYEIG